MDLLNLLVETTLETKDFRVSKGFGHAISMPPQKSLIWSKLFVSPVFHEV